MTSPSLPAGTLPASSSSVSTGAANVRESQSRTTPPLLIAPPTTQCPGVSA